ncbi:23S rRNA pseudouridine(2605) synthase RluB [Vibrio cincinnatiensis]|jgi:23S rRNA pseudouridine2605 synthase|uniref:Pseudouridine synthase n=1 Tax=Vibrio cincinnatiensis DSM 19608 TaxID=1123491 RepID=A0A1T4KCZ4_VIBCI|nr:23S rRNA pseudouridine(2605) synthase RluB [Vibrio cincinnatiensis]MCG3731256.1 23S rRNA pseudouridine(2605) synthase RluB [Vibrio cincinnatiensis]MCG3738769.1 23S rRNA pseudouridine(2605) synthase RluB [Vibrio cincinnatiensis]MCG3742377.1 23S rRNA pseudouridine(2605) synthase RluB [Vibrio cincinnatiensis]MCG3758821.1 23S rRNA pseudouridine(2605) synthase RluB [Vibrio cincinnatiensis]MCG3762171.1 23S rRNA pseudouridine(2605) synthase RluB [Vibrio cincinnatiensis]
MSEKLQKVLARAGHGSRRELEALIRAGRVSVNGKVAVLGERLDDENAVVRIDGHAVSAKAQEEVICRVLAYYKPEGELCTRHDPEGRRTVFDRLPKIRGSRWISVGRLDANTSGLLLFTTDGELANRLMHPSRQVEREYLVRVFGEINEEKVRNLVRGVQLEDGLARFEDVVYAGGEGMNHTFYVVINEGRNREVRRLWESQDTTVSRLKRVRYGDIFLDKKLPRGGWMELDLKQVNYLRELVELRPERETMLDQSKDNTSRKRERSRSQKIRRAVRRHEERVTTGSTKPQSRTTNGTTTNKTPTTNGTTTGRRKPASSTRNSGVEQKGRPSSRRSQGGKAPRR